MLRAMLANGMSDVNPTGIEVLVNYADVRYLCDRLGGLIVRSKVAQSILVENQFTVEHLIRVYRALKKV